MEFPHANTYARPRQRRVSSGYTPTQVRPCGNGNANNNTGAVTPNGADLLPLVTVGAIAATIVIVNKILNY